MRIGGKRPFPRQEAPARASPQRGRGNSWGASTVARGVRLAGTPARSGFRLVRRCSPIVLATTILVLGTPSASFVAALEGAPRCKTTNVRVVRRAARATLGAGVVNMKLSDSEPSSGDTALQGMFDLAQVRGLLTGSTTRPSGEVALDEVRVLEGVFNISLSGLDPSEGMSLQS